MPVKEVDIYEFFKPRLLKEFEKKYPSRTKIEEHGVFKRIYQRKGTQKRQKTERMKDNPAKVVINHVGSSLGQLEVYVYPYDYPDTVFLGKYPVFSVGFTELQAKQLFWCKWKNVMVFQICFF